MVNRQPRNSRGRGHRRVVGLVATAGAFLAFGMTPLIAAPAANADGLDVILDPILNSLSSVDPAMATDLGAVVTSFDPTFAADSAATAAATPDFSELFNQFVYTPTHTALEDWISSTLGHQVDGFINSAAGFPDGPKVMNGASDLMVTAFGDKGRHARTTVGVAALPLDAAVEVEGSFEVS